MDRPFFVGLDIDVILAILSFGTIDQLSVLQSQTLQLQNA